ncbi:MAG TPA: HlyD family secretion protein [Acidobacteriaceae bacterium]|nr:HlyD family secretion protein [Acidobacteriaceae bacterium]
MAELRSEQIEQESGHSDRRSTVARPSGGQDPDLREDDAKDQSSDETEMSSQAKHPAHKGFLIIGAVVLVLIGVGLFWWHSTYYEDTDDAQVDGNLVQISARIKGNIIKVNVEDNQAVQKGQVLVEIDPRDAQAALDAAEAKLATAKANYEAALASVPITTLSTGATLSGAGADVRAALSTIAQSEKQLDAAQAEVLAAQADNTKAQLDLQRYTPLVKRDVVSRQQFDAIVAIAASKKAQLAQAQANLSGAKDQVRVANDKLASARAAYNSAGTGPKQIAAQKAKADAAAAEVQAAEAELEADRLNLSYTKIVAPESGIVNKRTAQVGQNVSAGQTMMTLIPLTHLWITANFKETQLNHMRIGQPATVKVDAYGGRTYHAKVTEIGGATGSMLSLFPPENATGNYVKVVQRIPVRLDFTNPKEDSDQLLRPGMSVTPTVRVKN